MEPGNKHAMLAMARAELAEASASDYPVMLQRVIK